MRLSISVFVTTVVLMIGLSGCGGEDVATLPADIAAGTPMWSQADPSCRPPDHSAKMPTSVAAYVKMCESHGLGVPPSFACEDGVQVPIQVDGTEVFEEPKSCDNSSMLKPICDIGSQINRIEGRDRNGNALPDVVWITFCRATGATQYSSVQMIAHHYKTGATCFFEANEGGNSILPERLGRDETGGLTGKMPAYDDPDFDRAFVPAPDQCVQCHQNNAFIRNPWLDGARLPDNPAEPVLPTVGAKSPYYIVGGGDWDMRTIHIEGNACLDCHRIGMEIDQQFAANGFDVNSYMPAHAPGTMVDDYQQLLSCWINGPENTEGCEWIIAPAAQCSGGIVGSDYPYKSKSFNQGDVAGGGKGGGAAAPCYETCIAQGQSAPECKSICSGEGSNTSAQCYKACIAKGEDPTLCTNECAGGGSSDDNDACYDACVAKGESPQVCKAACG
ncbi:MAG TPA: hypothetical protein DCQ06_11830 [Myxococcales bacterium]|nr:hypothetical protein [Myxococcales bacterium]